MSWRRAIPYGIAPAVDGDWLFGDHASRPAAASGNNGFYYYETDTDDIYLSNGSAWTLQPNWFPVDYVELTSNKNQNSGYAGLDSGGKVAQAQLGSGSGGAGSKFLADDQTYKTVSATAGVSDIAKSGSTPLTGSVTLSQGTNVTLTQSGNDISIASTGSAGGMTKLYDSDTDGTVSLPQQTIDTGAGGISTSHDILHIWIYSRTDEAVAFSTLTMTVNNDSSSIYDRQFTRGSNATASAGVANATAGWTIATAGSSQAAGTFGVFRFSFPCYAQTVGHKEGEANTSIGDGTAANQRAELQALKYRATTAISRFAVSAPAGKNLVAGTRVLIYGL